MSIHQRLLELRHLLVEADHFSFVNKYLPWRYPLGGLAMAAVSSLLCAWFIHVQAYTLLIGVCAVLVARADLALGEHSGRPGTPVFRAIEDRGRTGGLGVLDGDELLARRDLGAPPVRRGRGLGREGSRDQPGGDPGVAHQRVHIPVPAAGARGVSVGPGDPVHGIPLRTLGSPPAAGDRGRAHRLARLIRARADAGGRRQRPDARGRGLPEPSRTCG